MHHTAALPTLVPTPIKGARLSCIIEQYRMAIQGVYARYPKLVSSHLVGAKTCRDSGLPTAEVPAQQSVSSIIIPTNTNDQFPSMIRYHIFLNGRRVEIHKLSPRLQRFLSSHSWTHVLPSPSLDFTNPPLTSAMYSSSTSTWSIVPIAQPLQPIYSTPRRVPRFHHSKQRLTEIYSRASHEPPLPLYCRRFPKRISNGQTSDIKKSRIKGRFSRHSLRQGAATQTERNALQHEEMQ